MNSTGRVNTAAHDVDLRRCNVAECATYLEVEEPVVATWLERGAPCLEDRGSSGEPIIDLVELFRWITSEKPSPDIDPQPLSQCGQRDYLCSEMHRVCIKGKAKLAEALGPTNKSTLALASLRIEIAEAVNLLVLDSGISVVDALSLNEKLQWLVERFVRRMADSQLGHESIRDSLH